MRVGNMTVVGRPVVSRTARLVILLAGPRFGWLGPDRGDVAAWSAVTKMPPEPGFTRTEPGFTRTEPGVIRLEVVVRPV